MPTTLHYLAAKIINGLGDVSDIDFADEVDDLVEVAVGLARDDIRATRGADADPDDAVDMLMIRALAELRLEHLLAEEPLARPAA